MDSPTPSKRLQQATLIASNVVSIAQTYFNNRTQLLVDFKNPEQSVTEADRDVETAIRNTMDKDFPGETIVGEEFGGETDNSFWTIDPIDGTANFLNGLPFWGIAIGHISNGVPDLGVIVLPELEVTVTAEDNALFVNGDHVARLITKVPMVSLGQATDDTLAESLAIHKAYRDAGFSVCHWRSSAVSLAWTALGKVSGHLHQKTTLWDSVPGAALCRAAGLDVRMSQGPKQSLWLKAGEPAVHEVVGHCWEDDQTGSQ